MFPSAGEARRFIDFDSRGFLVDGKRTFLTSAGLEYARMPRALWADRLLRLKRAGFNTVEFYTFWDFHEPHEGQFEFTGDHDLNAFLQLVKSMGMYAIARVGPYSCAEWSMGGYPIWLRFKPGVVLRTDNAPFLQALDRFWDRLLPVVAANQIQNGGAVVLVQLENEHPLAWGTGLPTPYFTHLRDQAVQHGIQVPYFFSQMHHGSDPAGDANSLDELSRPNPWITTEFWSVWFNQYGSRPGDASTYRRRTWKVIAHGGNGYNIYMAYGGSNFDYYNNNEDAASYDYGSPVGQGGDLRPTYYEFKKANYFAQAFATVLENSTDNSAAWVSSLSNASMRVSARKGPAGEILFVDNPPAPAEKVASPDPNNPTFEAVADNMSSRTLSTTTFTAGDISLRLALEPGEIVPLVHGVQIAPGIKLDWSSAHILGIAHCGHTTTLVAYGDPGHPDQLIFSGPALQQVGAPGHASAITLNEPYSGNAPIERDLVSGKEHLRVLLMTRLQADHTWFVGEAGRELVVTGPDYLHTFSLDGTQVKAQAEIPWTGGSSAAHSAARVEIYGEGTPFHASLGEAKDHPTALPSSPWQIRTGAAVRPDFDDSAWPRTDDPVEMGGDGNLTAYAWYRSRISVPQAGDYLLDPSGGGDQAKVFIDGRFAVEGAFSARPLPLHLSAGPHSLAIFVSHSGRQKLFAYLGPLQGHDPKGLSGPVTLRQGKVQELAGWRMRHVSAGESKTVPPTDTAGWKPFSVRVNAPRSKRTPENTGAAWFETILPAATEQGRRVLRFTSIDEAVTVYVNGRQLGSFRGRDQAFSIALPGGLTGTPRLDLLVESGGRPYNITGPIFLEQIDTEENIKCWRSHGGPETTANPAAWATMQGDLSANQPTFFRSTFLVSEGLLAESGITWRVSTTGLGHGSVWINGHNLGRYPERIPVAGEFVPQAWMHPGENELLVYDEDGKSPQQVQLKPEPGASRNVVSLTATNSR